MLDIDEKVIKEVLEGDKYRHLRDLLDELKEVDFDTFFKIYKQVILKVIVDYDEGTNMGEIEIYSYLYLYILFDTSYEDLNLLNLDTTTTRSREHEILSKSYFCYLELSKLRNLSKNTDILSDKKLRELLGRSKKPGNLLINGKKPNVSERYFIANEIFNLRTTIDKKNISAKAKHILLAHTLGCSEQVARELFNGTQEKRTPVREDLVQSYLEKLK